MLNWFKLLFSHINLHFIHYTDKEKTELSQLCKCITNKKPEISTLHKYSYSTFTFTFMHLADAFIQSDLHFIQVSTFYQLLLSLGIEPMILALLVPCSTSWATGKPNSKLSTLAEATLQPQVFLGMIRHALLISIWQLYTILHLTSSCLKLCQVGWGQTPDSIGFSRMICLGLIPIIVYKPLLLCA